MEPKMGTNTKKVSLGHPLKAGPRKNTNFNHLYTSPNRLNWAPVQAPAHFLKIHHASKSLQKCHFWTSCGKPFGCKNCPKLHFWGSRKKQKIMCLLFLKKYAKCVKNGIPLSWGIAKKGTFFRVRAQMGPQGCTRGVQGTIFHYFLTFCDNFLDSFSLHPLHTGNRRGATSAGL